MMASRKRTSIIVEAEESDDEQTKENLDLYMQCDEEDLSNSQLQLYNNSYQNYNVVDTTDGYRNSAEWDTKVLESDSNTFMISKVVEVDDQQHSANVGIRMATKNTPRARARANAVISESSLRRDNFDVEDSSSEPNISSIVEPEVIVKEESPMAVKAVLVNNVTGQIYGEVMNPAKGTKNQAGRASSTNISRCISSSRTPTTSVGETNASSLLASTLTSEKIEKVIPSPIPDVSESELEEIWSSGNLDALKLQSSDATSSTTFENLPPGVKTTIAFIHDYDKDYARRLKDHLDIKLASSGIFSKDSNNITEWMMDAGLLNDLLKCPHCASTAVMRSTVTSDHIDKHMWKCTKCSRTKSIRFLSFFDYHPVKLQSLLVLVYHWAFSSDTLKLFMTVQENMPSSPRPLPILVNFWLSIRRLCSTMITKNIFCKPFGGPNKQLVIDSIVIPKGIIILAAHEVDSTDVRFKVIGPSDYKSYKGTLQTWVENETIIYTNKENIKRSLTVKSVTFMQLSELPVTDDSVDLAKYLSEEVATLFGAEFFSSPVVTDSLMERNKGMRQKTLFNVSLKNTMKETIELMQLALDEVMWRSHYGRTEAEAFVNILKAIATNDTIDLRLAVHRTEMKKLPPVTMARQTKPVVNASLTIPKATVISQPPAKKMPIKIPMPQHAFPQVILENYYYASYTPEVVDQNTLLKLDNPELKCQACNMMCSDNIQYMKHVMLHMDNYRMNDLSNLTQCKHCYRNFDTPYNMQCHMSEVHLSKSTDILLCRICEVRFYEVEKLTLHMRVYHKENEMPYICEICMYRSSFYGDLVSHFHQVHKSTNKLLCPYCLRVFSTMSKVIYFKHLLRHQSRKSAAVKGRCKSCCLSFILDTDLKQHIGRAHVNTSSIKVINPDQISKKSVPTKTMIPHPNQPLKVKTITKTPPASSSVKTIVITRTKPKPRPTFDVHRLAISPDLEQYQCIECSHPIASNHFLRLMWCSRCNYETYCSKSYSEHMIKEHSSKDATEFTENVKHKAMYCLCHFSSRNMLAMAKHLVKCRKTTCYPGPPLSDCDQPHPDDIHLEVILDEGDYLNLNVETGLSLSSQIAAINRPDGISQVKDSSTDEPSKMLSVLGLMRRTGSATSTKNEGKEDSNPATSTDRMESSVSSDAVKKDDAGDGAAEMDCLMAMPVEVNIKEEAIPCEEEDDDVDNQNVKRQPSPVEKTDISD